jgi:hypothetical protein
MSQPSLRTPSSTVSSPVPCPLTSSQLLQRVEQSLIILLNICDQYSTTSVLWLSPTATKFEIRVLTNNLCSLVSQLETVVVILRMYSCQPSFLSKGIMSLLPARDREFLKKKLLPTVQTYGCPYRSRHLQSSDTL